jgi:hypothetical protein
MKEKGKKVCMHGLGLAHDKASLPARIWPKLKKSPLGFEYFASETPIYFKNY